MTAAAAGRRAPALSLRALDRGTWTDVGVVVALSLLAVLGFEPAFGAHGYLVAGVGGLVLGTAVALAGRLARLGIVSTIAIALGVYLLLGSPLTMPQQAIGGVLPNLTTLSGLVQGAVFAWGDIVTLQAPVEAPPYIAVLPYFAAWAATFTSVSLACRWLPRRPRTALRASVLVVPAVLLFLAGILVGTDRPYYAGVRGVAFAVVALVWLGWRRRGRDVVAITTDGSARRRKLVGVAVIVAGAIILGVGGGIVLAPSAASRFVLRQEITPPFDPLQYPSPLAGFRTYTKKLEKTDLFTVQGLQDGQKVRLATMDSYDGEVWRVASPTTQTSDSGAFELLGRDIPRPPLARAGGESTLRFSIEGYKDVWLPDAEYPRTLDFTSFTGVDPTTTVRINTVTGTAAVTSGVARGLRYTLGVTTPTVPSDKRLARVPAAHVSLPPVQDVPDVVAAKAKEYAGTAKTTIQQLRNIERSLKTVGYLSHGRASDPVPSRAGEGADRMTELFTREPMVGDEEQYASAFALMARSLGYPARVVMGFAPKVPKGGGTVTVKGGDVTAWVEVAFEGVGWIPFYPTPTKTDAPQEQTTRPKLEPQPQVRQPPTTNEKQDDVLTPVKISDKNPDDKKGGFAIPTWAYVVAGVVGIPLLAYLVPLLVIAALKRRRRRTRLTTGPPDRRVAGSWEELADRYGELGIDLPARSTRLQTAGAIERQAREQGLAVPEAGLAPIAASVDAAVFSAADVDDAAVEAAWREADATVAASYESAGWLRRRLAAFRVRRGPRAVRAVRRPAMRVRSNPRTAPSATQ